VADNIVYITDNTIYSRSSYYAKVKDITITGAEVLNAYEDGTTVNIVLGGATADGTEIGIAFGTLLNKCTISGNTGTATIANGRATATMTVTVAKSLFLLSFIIYRVPVQVHRR
jgi:hypothetical protein